MLDSLEEGNDNATKILVKGKGSGSAGRTTEHSLDGGFGILALATIHHASGSERIDGNVITRDLRVKVNDSGSYSLANIGSNANKGKVGSGLDDVDVGSQKAPHKSSEQNMARRERARGGRPHPRPTRYT